jgi:hypothetical protein
MRLKPIPLAAYSKDFVPPVTGVGGLYPVANQFDHSGIFPDRNRAGSLSKKRRIDEIDQVFNLSASYPPLVPPERPALDVGQIRTLLVTAVAAGEEAKPLIENPDTDEKIKTFGNLSLALLKLMEAMVENGLIPLTGTGTGTGPNLKNNSPPAPPPPSRNQDSRNYETVLRRLIPNRYFLIPT